MRAYPKYVLKNVDRSITKFIITAIKFLFNMTGIVDISVTIKNYNVISSDN